jgi:acetylornithine/N-succinyldiaminopimelate aminotransferase
MEHILWCVGHELIIEDIVSAENCYLYDSAGKKYTDLESGLWCTSVGHGHPRITKVIKEQADKIIHTGYCYASPVIEETAKEILSLLNFTDGKCVFLSSGSEAVEFGVQVVQKLLEKPLLLTLSDSYFGAYGSASQRTENEWVSFDWIKKCSRCSRSESCDLNCEQLKEMPFDKIGAFIFEPGSSSGLVRFPPLKLIQNICRRIKDNNGLLIMNEITTGIGRTGKWFGYQHYDIQPDIVAIGKGIGNGCPVSATAMSADAVGRLKTKSFKYAQSHLNDPLGAAVANEVIQIIKEEKLIDRCKNIGSVFVHKLEQLKKRFGLIKEIRSRGLLIAIEINDDESNSLTSFIFSELLKRRFIIARRPNLNVLRVDPPLTIEEKDIEAFFICFKNILNEAANKSTQ